MAREKLIKLGDRIGLIDGYEYTGTIVKLSEYEIAVRIDSPLSSVITLRIPINCREKWGLAFLLDNEYYCTSEGVDAATELLMRIAEEEDVIMSDEDVLADMLDEFHEKESDRYAKRNDRYNKEKKDKDEYPSMARILAGLQCKYFNGLKEIVFTEDLMSRIGCFLKRA